MTLWFGVVSSLCCAIDFMVQVTVRFARGAPRGGANRGGGAARNTSSWRKMQKKLEEEAWLTGRQIARVVHDSEIIDI